MPTALGFALALALALELLADFAEVEEAVALDAVAFALTEDELPELWSETTPPSTTDGEPVIAVLELSL